RYPRLQRLLYLKGGAEVTICRHQPVDAAVRPAKIVSIDKEPDAPARVPQVDEHRRLEALPPQRSPETLDLPQRLRVPWPGHHLLDAALVELFAEHALAPPSHVLAAVVRQDLLRRAIRGQRRPQHLEHQGGR